MGEFTLAFLISILPRLPVLLAYLVGVGVVTTGVTIAGLVLLMFAIFARRASSA